MKTKYSATSREECTRCPALCCKNLSMEIGKPVNRKEIEDLKWQLHFDTVKVYIRHRRWYQMVEGTCMYLSNDRCTIYEHRPKKCRAHNPPNCERFGEFFDVMLATPQELEDYYQNHMRRRRKGTKKKDPGRGKTERV
ncbi:MAG: hypothetical protein GF333_01385 [Candidatus Omnitrophica bacterium]|nr:hypothetical protein [Candidatus Omnitrophota bacterium]